MAKKEKKVPVDITVNVKEWHFPRILSIVLKEAEMQPTLPEAFARWVKMEEYPPDCILVHFVGNNDQWGTPSANRFSAYRNAGAGEQGRMFESEAAKYEVIAFLQVNGEKKDSRKFYGIWRPRVDSAA